MRLLAVSLGALLLPAMPALAGFVQTETSITGQIFQKNFSPQVVIQQFDSHNTQPDVLVSHPLSQTGHLGGSDGSVFADAQIGVLRAAASGVEGVDVAVFPDANVSMVGNAGFYDVLHVTSATLPAGTAVTLHFEIDLHGTLTHPSHTGDPWNDEAASSIQADSSHDSLLLQIDTESGLNNFAGEFHSVVGDTIQIHAKLSAGVLLPASSPVRDAGASYESTGRYYIFSEDPGAAVSAESTFDFTPVPEPGTVILLLAGAPLLLRPKRVG
jgi:hypothetical protein